MPEEELQKIAMLIGKPVYTLKEFIDNHINAEEKLVTPAKNINGYYVVEDCVYTTKELIHLREDCEIFDRYLRD